MKNYFMILGVHRDSTYEELKEARRVKAYEAHPDRPGGGNVDQMLEVNEAYNVLSSPPAKRQYILKLEGGYPKCDVCRGRGYALIRTGGFKGTTSKVICADCEGAGVAV